MSSHTLLTTAAITVLVGCSSAANAFPITPQPQLRCPAGECGDPNGIGIFTAEDGAAGIGPERLLITHFVNTGTVVHFDGLYLDDASQQWKPLAELGTVYAADYGEPAPQAPRMTVRSVRESHTVPTWTIIDRNRKTRNVSGEDLQHLTLYISFQIVSHGLRQYALDFDSAEITERVSRFNMRWRDLSPNAQPAQYCFVTAPVPHRPDLPPPPPPPPDQVVFQQGIEVDPGNGRVTRDATAFKKVALSCFLGAPATVYGWGYEYRAPADTFYFDAGIHMKRASYCADEHHYTVSGTPIMIADDQGLNPEHRTRRPVPLEAWWTPTGASCLNAPDGLRHADLVPNRGVGLTCPGQPPLQPCLDPPSSGGPHYLGDGPLNPGP